MTPCDIGEGDCDTGHDCKVGLTCGYNNCVAPEQGRHWFNAGDDCCEPSKAAIVVAAADVLLVMLFFLLLLLLTLSLLLLLLLMALP